jgi:hypothetical protein
MPVPQIPGSKLRADAGTLIGILRALVAAGSTKPLAAQTAAVTALGDICLVLSHADVDARSVAAPVQAGGCVAELLKLNTVDLMVNRLWWVWEELAKGSVAGQRVDFQEDALVLAGARFSQIMPCADGCGSPALLAFVCDVDPT